MKQAGVDQSVRYFRAVMQPAAHVMVRSLALHGRCIRTPTCGTLAKTFRDTRGANCDANGVPHVARVWTAKWPM